MRNRPSPPVPHPRSHYLVTHSHPHCHHASGDNDAPAQGLRQAGLSAHPTERVTVDGEHERRPVEGLLGGDHFKQIIVGNR